MLDFPETAVVLAAHGAPATDCPKRRVGLLVALEMSNTRLRPLVRLRERLEREIRDWPRTPANDPYKAAVDTLAAALSDRLRCPVVAGYNEFCNPTIAQALDRAVAAGARRVIVIPTMLLRGNEHTEAEIRGAVDSAPSRHPGVTFRYAFPFPLEALLDLYARQVTDHLAG